MDYKILPPKDRYCMQWIGRCQYEQHDKIWGWFYYFQHGYKTNNTFHPICYTFWARTGKTPSFKRHVSNKWAMKKLINSKESKKYNRIEVEHLEFLWPTIWNDIENKFVFYLLSEKI